MWNHFLNLHFMSLFINRFTKHLKAKCVKQHCARLLLLVISSGLAAEPTSNTLHETTLKTKMTQIKQSQSDHNQYRYLELDNGLKVILASDTKAEKASAALAVAVGANDNPQGQEGLTHFLEHMLFLGTKKYPEAGEYKTYINEFGGSNNAYTAANHTNYFFDIQSYNSNNLYLLHLYFFLIFV